MTFSLEWSPGARDSLAALPVDLQARIIAKTLSTLDDPRRFFAPLKGRAGFRLRVGDHRVLADISFRHRHIVVTRIGNRRNIYD